MEEDEKFEQESGFEDETGEEGIYDDEEREEMLENDEIDSSEDGFMQGAEGKGSLAVCKQCKKPLQEDKDNIVEREIDGKEIRFCSEECYEKYIEKL